MAEATISDLSNGSTRPQDDFSPAEMVRDEAAPERSANQVAADLIAAKSRHPRAATGSQRMSLGCGSGSSTPAAGRSGSQLLPANTRSSIWRKRS
jgi:hypothetical protein